MSRVNSSPGNGDSGELAMTLTDRYTESGSLRTRTVRVASVLDVTS